MPHFLIQAAYAAGAAKAMVASPQDRTEAIGKIVASAGGRVQSVFFALGDYDLVIIAELPNNTSAAAVALNVGSTGALARYKTTALLTPQEAVTAMGQAQGLTYSPPA